MKYLFKYIAYVLVIFLILEGSLRLMGYSSYKPPVPWTVDFLKPDSLKGWVHIPGEYELPINKWGDTMNFVIDSKRERVTKTRPIPEAAEEILLIGGSFTMGMGLDDDQTFAWKLQQEFPSVDIRNLGVGAYGTYQSLLVLREELMKSKKPKAVIYGFISHHRFRNVAQSDWLHSMGLVRKKPESDVELPFVFLEDNETLTPGKPFNLIQVPFSENLATSFMLQRAINKLSEREKMQKSGLVLELLLLEMQKLCEEHEVQFYVNVLYSENSLMSKMRSFFAQNNIEYIDCNIPLNGDNTFKDDGHPKEVIQDEWTKRISQRLVRDSIVPASTMNEDTQVNDR